MGNARVVTRKPSYSPLDLENRPLVWQLSAVVFGAVLLTVSSYVAVPMVPVPITMQTFAVALVGALYGWRLGSITVTAWLLLGALGMPVLADGAAGAHHFLGATGGYLFAFPIAAGLAGWLAELGWNGNHLGLAFINMLLSTAACLVLGAAWLAIMIGIEQALVHGVAPFLVGAFLKSALGAATLKALVRGRMRPV